MFVGRTEEIKKILFDTLNSDRSLRRKLELFATLFKRGVNER
jgi:hypothetical protein